MMTEKSMILSRVGFCQDKKPFLFLIDSDGNFKIINPEFGRKITISIDTSKRYCVGWHDLSSGKNFACPDKLTIDSKHEQCRNCQAKTGFNPAFYNVSEDKISAQQLDRNAQPHFVYLAYFSDDIIKVGISFSGRGIARLLEQGARSALILGTFSSANIARKYEEEISKMQEFCENVKASKKIKLLGNAFNFNNASQKLVESRSKIEARLNKKFDKNSPMNLDVFYAKNGEVPCGEMISIEDCLNDKDEIVFSGVLRAQVGYILIAEQQDDFIVIPLKKYTGYKIKITDDEIALKLPERQASFFDLL